jgi:hypothetical protein
MKRILVIVILAVILLASTVAYADEHRESKFLGYNTYLYSVCLEGHVFVAAIIRNAGASVTQVYEMKDGKLVPKTCQGSK